jgi:predicted RNase H-like nuclease (RuvC/YqgF family)
MSDNEIQQKKGRTKKNGQPDKRSTSSAANVSKARSKVKAFLKAGKQIIDNSDSEESGDDIIDLVIRKKDEKIDDSEVIRRTPLKQVLKAKKKRFEQPDSSGSDEDDEETKIIPQPKISKSKAKMQDMERKHKELEEQIETMKRGIIETANKKTDSYDIGVLRKNMILRF